ncbi:CP [Malus domestica virus A]|uniref:CP n=1 Tax=Malus domestica virus A TaxID=2664236 RepID=A0A5Q0TZ02_9CLOS|nr:CP [Malus domestica virus A]QGA73180.1 CP [Malus domestica virus A]
MSVDHASIVGVFSKLTGGRTNYERIKKLPNKDKSQSEKDVEQDFENTFRLYLHDVALLTKESLKQYGLNPMPVGLPQDLIDEYKTLVEKISATVEQPTEQKHDSAKTAGSEQKFDSMKWGSTTSSQGKPSDLSFKSKMKIKVQAANELTPSQVGIFKDVVYDFFRTAVFNLKTDENIPMEMWSAAFASYLASLVEQSTSRQNISNINLLNSFEVNEKIYEWNRADIMRAIYAKFDEMKIPNAERRFMRAEYENNQRILANAGFVPSQRLAAQWGVAGPYRSNVSDCTPLYKSMASAKEQTAQMAATEYATTKGEESSDVVHVSQIMGSRRRR